MGEKISRIRKSKQAYTIRLVYLCIILLFCFVNSCSSAKYQVTREHWESDWCNQYLLNCPDDLHKSSSIPILISAVDKDPSCEVQGWALTALSNIKPRTEQITDAIVDALKKPDCEHKLTAALQAAPTIGNRINEVIPNLVNYIVNYGGTKDSIISTKYSRGISWEAATLVGNIELTDDRIIEALQTSSRNNAGYSNGKAASESYRKLTSLIIKSADEAEINVPPFAMQDNTPPQPRNQTDTIKPVKYEKRIALIIGNANYSNAGILANPGNDAREIEKVLKSLNFETYRYDNCDLNMMKRAILNFVDKLMDFDVRFFFYSGHGVQVDGVNYFLPTNVTLKREQDVEFECIKMDYLLAQMERKSKGINIIMMDACRTNPFEKSWNRGPIGKGLASPKAMPIGSIIGFATSPNRVALDGSGANSPYTAAFVKYVVEPGTNIESLFKKVRKVVLKETTNAQLPWESTPLTEDFYFNK